MRHLLLPGAPVEALSFVVGGERQSVGAHGMPRLDLFRTLEGTDEDPHGHSYRSGFWGTVKIEPTTSPELTLGLEAELTGRKTATAEIAQLRISELTPDTSELPTAAVVICMTTHEPHLDLLRAQLDSIRAQTHTNWACLISDDCSRPDRLAQIEAEVAGDDRFTLSHSPRRLGFYANFERALAMAPAEAEYVAMADQDDRWDPDKLETLVGAIDGAQLAYSDARLVSPRGERLADTYWGMRDNNHSDISTLLMANSVTGAASLMRRELLDYALPFPPAQFAHFHDHWIALTALALGDIEFVDRPLYDYTQHDAAVLGHAAANRRTAMGDRVAKLGEDPRERVRRWRMHFFVDNCRLSQFATVLELRCGERMAAAKRRALRPFAAANASRRRARPAGRRAPRAS